MVVLQAITAMITLINISNFYGDSIIHRSHDTIMFSTKIEWKKITDLRGRQAYYMDFSGGGYIVDEIKNRELILLDNANDGMAHYLRRTP